MGEAEEGDQAAGDFARASRPLSFGMRKVMRQELVIGFTGEVLIQILTAFVCDIQPDNGQKFLLTASCWRKPCRVHASCAVLRNQKAGRCGRGSTGFGVRTLECCQVSVPGPGAGY